MIYTFVLRWTILFMLKLWKLRYFYIVFTGNLNLKPQKIVETTFYDRLIYFSTCSFNAISLSTYTWVPVGLINFSLQDLIRQCWHCKTLSERKKSMLMRYEKLYTCFLVVVFHCIKIYSQMLRIDIEYI